MLSTAGFRLLLLVTGFAFNEFKTVLAWTQPPRCIPLGSRRLPHFSTSLFAETSSQVKPVLVVGATGKVGRRVVQQLMAADRPVRAVVRDRLKAQEIFGTSDSLQYPSIEIIQADLSRPEDFADVLERAVSGSSSIISVMGVVRFAKLSDFWPWRVFSWKAEWADRDHPYYGNYVGQKYLIDLAEKYKMRRFVRLTGLGLAYSPFNPFSILFNTLLSFNNKWGLLCEQALFSSKVPYVVLRPGGLSDTVRDTESTNVQIDASGKLPFPGRIGRTDVAALAVAAVDLPDDAPRSLTLACRWCGEGVKPKPQGQREDGYSTAKECLSRLYEQKLESPSPPKSKPYALAVALVVYSSAALFFKLLCGTWGLFYSLFLKTERWKRNASG